MQTNDTRKDVRDRCGGAIFAGQSVRLGREDLLMPSLCAAVSDSGSWTLHSTTRSPLRLPPVLLMACPRWRV